MSHAAGQAACDGQSANDELVSRSERQSLNSSFYPGAHTIAQIATYPVAIGLTWCKQPISIKQKPIHDVRMIAEIVWVERKWHG